MTRAILRTGRRAWTQPLPSADRRTDMYGVPRGTLRMWPVTFTFAPAENEAQGVQVKCEIPARGFSELVERVREQAALMSGACACRVASAYSHGLEDAQRRRHAWATEDAPEGGMSTGQYNARSVYNPRRVYRA